MSGCWLVSVTRTSEKTMTFIFQKLLVAASERSLNRSRRLLSELLAVCGDPLLTIRFDYRTDRGSFLQQIQKLASITVIFFMSVHLHWPSQLLSAMQPSDVFNNCRAMEASSRYLKRIQTNANKSWPTSGFGRRPCSGIFKANRKGAGRKGSKYRGQQWSGGSSTATA